jgi:pyroglutamyl-peptidase
VTTVKHVKARRTILLTGFGPFPGVEENASSKLVPALAATAREAFAEHAFLSEILDTAWDSAPARVAALLAHHKPHLALHFGVAREAQGFRLERLALNACRVAADATGALPSHAALSLDGPICRASHLDTAALAARLEGRGYPVSLSDDAGAYLCNAVLYHSLAAAEALGRGACRSGFVHIPADLSGPPLAFQDALEGSLEIIRACLEAIDAPIES